MINILDKIKHLNGEGLQSESIENNYSGNIVIKRQPVNTCNFSESFKMDEMNE